MSSYKKVFYAAPGWFEIASSKGLEVPLIVDWEADPVQNDDWNDACAAVGFDHDDIDVGFGLVTQRRPEDKGYQVGDIAATDGANFVVLRRVIKVAELSNDTLEILITRGESTEISKAARRELKCRSLLTFADWKALAATARGE